MCRGSAPIAQAAQYEENHEETRDAPVEVNDYVDPNVVRELARRCEEGQSAIPHAAFPCGDLALEPKCPRIPNNKLETINCVEQG